jgi:hypothetical protein
MSALDMLRMPKDDNAYLQMVSDLVDHHKPDLMKDGHSLEVFRR